MTAFTFHGDSAITKGTSFAIIDDINQISGASFSGERLTRVGSSNGLFGADGHYANFATQAQDGGHSFIYGITITDNASNAIFSVTGLRDLLPVSKANYADPITAQVLADFLQNMFRGNDEITLTGNVSLAWGDYNTVPVGAAVNMGDDLVISSGALTGGFGSIYGDAKSLLAGRTAIAGDDVLDLSSAAVTVILYGDFGSVAGTATYGNDRMFGSSQADTLYGDSSALALANGGNDQLYGNGGADTLHGGGGNDMLHGGFEAADVLDGGAGFDYASYAVLGSTYVGTVIIDLQTPANNTLDAAGDTYTGIEGLLGRDQASYADDMRGDSGANVIKAFAGNDILNGRAGNDQLFGGKGNDTLTGGNGADKFVFSSALSAATNVDTITAFDALDRIVLDDDIFTKVGATFDAGEFRSINTGTSFAAVDASDRIIYLKSQGELYYDQDGSGAAARVLFCKLTGNPALDFSDFILVG